MINLTRSLKGVITQTILCLSACHLAGSVQADRIQNWDHIDLHTCFSYSSPHSVNLPMGHLKVIMPDMMNPNLKTSTSFGKIVGVMRDYELLGAGRISVLYLNGPCSRIGSGEYACLVSGTGQKFSMLDGAHPVDVGFLFTANTRTGNASLNTQGRQWFPEEVVVKKVDCSTLPQD